MDNTEKALAIDKLVQDMLVNCCEYLYLSAGLEQNDAQTQAQIKASTIQNDVLREGVENQKKMIEQGQEEGHGARGSNPDAELPLVEEAQIVDNPVDDAEVDDLMKDFDFGTENEDDAKAGSGDVLNMGSAQEFVDKENNYDDGDSL